MCNGNCNQGRNCPDWRQCQLEGSPLKEAIVDAAFVVAVVIVVLICLLLAQGFAEVVWVPKK